MDDRLIVINLWAGPGAGKSTAAAGLFNLMKNRGYRVELVTEFAKDLTYSKRYHDLQNQLYVLAEQDYRMRRLIGQARFVITDSPLLLSLVYKPTEGPFSQHWFTDGALALFRSYENYNIRIKRTKPYSTLGRTQKIEEAREIDQKVDDLLNKSIIEPILNVAGDADAPRTILDWLENTRMIFPT